MYVSMEDSYKDVNEQWLIDFVTDKDRIIILWELTNYLWINDF